VLGGLLRDWRPIRKRSGAFRPFFDLNIWRFFKQKALHRRTAFTCSSSPPSCSPSFCAGLGDFRPATAGSFLSASGSNPIADVRGALRHHAVRRHHAAEDLEQHAQRKKAGGAGALLVEARLAALTSQINPHFLFNTLNSVSSLIRTDPNQARVMVVKLSKVLRRLLRKHENFSALRDELSFIEDYLAIEVVRFGDKLRFERTWPPTRWTCWCPACCCSRWWRTPSSTG
jgi:two-component system, LytTR family, sensor kinase